eukprot:1250123-Amphidinium_carterae.1
MSAWLWPAAQQDDLICVQRMQSDEGLHRRYSIASDGFLCVARMIWMSSTRILHPPLHSASSTTEHDTTLQVGYLPARSMPSGDRCPVREHLLHHSGSRNRAKVGWVHEAHKTAKILLQALMLGLELTETTMQACGS